MKTDDKSRFFSMATIYNQMAQLLVPKYDFFQNEVLDMVCSNGSEPKVVVDLGGGSGIFLKKVLERTQHTQCYLVDFSMDFLRIAEKNLEAFGNRIRLIQSPLEHHWETQIRTKADAIISMSAIHHLTQEEKRELYGRCFNMLNPKGWFFNVDEMKATREDAYVNTLNYWLRYVKEQEKNFTDGELINYQKWNVHFDKWATRNIHNAHIPKKKGDDIHECYGDQLTWLEHAGFENVDLFIKYHLWSIIGGQKPHQ